MGCYTSKNKAHKSFIPLRINKLLKNQKFIQCVSSFLTLSRLPGTQYPVSMIHSDIVNLVFSQTYTEITFDYELS